jgi:hypothetical protein
LAIASSSPTGVAVPKVPSTDVRIALTEVGVCLTDVVVLFVPVSDPLALVGALPGTLTAAELDTNKV